MSGLNTQMLGYYRNNDGKIDLQKAASDCVKRGCTPNASYSQIFDQISGMVSSGEVASSQNGLTAAYSGVQQKVATPNANHNFTFNNMKKHLEEDRVGVTATDYGTTPFGLSVTA